MFVIADLGDSLQIIPLSVLTAHAHVVCIFFTSVRRTSGTGTDMNVYIHTRMRSCIETRVVSRSCTAIDLGIVRPTTLNTPLFLDGLYKMSTSQTYEALHIEDSAQTAGSTAREFIPFVAL